MRAWYSATPTSVAASAPNMCEIAIRCGIAVIGTQHAERDADDRADDEAADDPVVADDLVVQQRADDGEQHADRGLLHAAARARPGAVRLRSPRMKRTEAARYAAWMK